MSEQRPGRREGAMSQVTVTINGRQFRMACEDGQEDHLRAARRGPRPAHRAAARQVRRDRRRPAHRDGGADGRRRAGRDRQASCSGSRTELAALQDARVASADRAKATQAAIVAALNAAAERIESMTRRLNQTVRRRRRGDGLKRLGCSATGVELRGGVGPRCALHCRAGLRGASGAHIPGALRS